MFGPPGRGPHESYLDRKEGAALRVWDGAVEAQTFRYCRPQENGAKVCFPGGGARTV